MRALQGSYGYNVSTYPGLEQPPPLCAYGRHGALGSISPRGNRPLLIIVTSRRGSGSHPHYWYPPWTGAAPALMRLWGSRGA